MTRKKYQSPDSDERDSRRGASKKGEIKLETVLLGIIALALVIQTFVMLTDSGDSRPVSSVQPRSFQGPGGNQGVQQTPSNPGIQQLTPGTQTPPPGSQPLSTQINPNQAASTPPASNTNIAISETNKDFGIVSAGQTLSHVFTVSNSGSNPLTLSTVYGDEGVNVKTWPTQPIPPGETGQITVDFNPGYEATTVSKVIHMNSNTEPQHNHITLSATVSN